MTVTTDLIYVPRAEVDAAAPPFLVPHEYVAFVEALDWTPRPEGEHL